MKNTKEEIKEGSRVERRHHWGKGIFGTVLFIEGDTAKVEWDSQTGTRVGSKLRHSKKLSALKLAQE